MNNIEKVGRAMADQYKPDHYANPRNMFDAMAKAAIKAYREGDEVRGLVEAAHNLYNVTHYCGFPEQHKALNIALTAFKGAQNAE